MAISKKGLRKIVVNDIVFHFKCISHETVFVYRENTNERFYYMAANSEECNKMSLPSLIEEKLKINYFKNEWCYLYKDLNKMLDIKFSDIMAAKLI